MSRLPPRVIWKKPSRPPVQPWGKNRPIPLPEPEEGLTGYVQGQDASAYEERFARSLDNNPRVQWYDFIKTYIAPPGTAGSKELDFLVGAGLIYAFQIDGDWIHKGAAARSKDEQSDTELNEFLAGTAQPIHRIKGHEIETQEMSNRLLEELL